ncbi:thiosulfate transmembrane transporter [Aureococcus anophagefferens]|nr:thiosulfate transmembrane transporter [Aureococcus anophagefferens]
MNLASTQPNYQPTGFVAFFLKTGKERGYASFYDGIGAGVIRQIFYATSRFGLFETFRDAIAARREIGVAERLAAGLASSACAAVISCPASAMLVGVARVGTLDQAKAFYDASFGIPKGTYGNVFAASMTSGLLYSLITMPFESAKNAWPSRSPRERRAALPVHGADDPLRGQRPGPLALWNGFRPTTPLRRPRSPCSSSSDGLRVPVVQ